jgi:hypothetical protein
VKNAENEIAIGHTAEADIPLNDITSNKEHAKISFKQGKFIISDCESRYGTLVFAPKL